MTALTADGYPASCPKHGTPRANGVMIGGAVYACDCAIARPEPPNPSRPRGPVTPQVSAPAGSAPLGLTPQAPPAAAVPLLQGLEAAARRPTPLFGFQHRQEELF